MGIAADWSARTTRWSADRPRSADVGFAAIVGLITLGGFLSASVEGSQRDQDVYGVLLIAVQTAAFAMRRRAPAGALWGVLVASMVFWIADYPTNFDGFTVLAVYAYTTHGGADRRRVWRVTAAAVGLITAVTVMGVLSPSEDLPAAAVVGIAAIHLTAAIAGEMVHERRLRVAELEDRARRAETERELSAQRAVLDERARIARDLHDVVAHGMSVMVVQAAAAQRVIDSHPDQARQALDHVQQVGRSALVEMRRMLGVLRDEGADPVALTPQPTIADVASIVQQCVESGIGAQLVVEGRTDHVSPGAELTVYRVVQEALTNVIKHAGSPVNALVRIGYDESKIDVEVTDDGIGSSDQQIRQTTGHGLVGMRERVELYDGTLVSGPRPGGGFWIRATVPLRTPVGTA